MIPEEVRVITAGIVQRLAYCLYVNAGPAEAMNPALRDKVYNVTFILNEAMRNEIYTRDQAVGLQLVANWPPDTVCKSEPVLEYFRVFRDLAEDIAEGSVTKLRPSDKDFDAQYEKRSKTSGHILCNV